MCEGLLSVERGRMHVGPTNSPTQFELSSDALCKVCTRVLLDSVPLPLHPDPLIPLTQLIDDKAMGSKRVD